MADTIEMKTAVKSYRKEVSNLISKLVQDDMDTAGAYLLKVTEPYVPKDTGALIESGRYKVRKKSVKITYGNKTDVKYAYSLHENVRNPSKGNRGPKYIERAARANQKGLEQKMLNKLSRLKALR